MGGLERSLNADTKIFALVGGKSGQLDVQKVKMESGDFFVELLGQEVNSNRVFLNVLPDLQLSHNLVTEGVGHNERRMSSGTSQVDETALSQKDDVSSVGQLVTVNLRLDVVSLGVSLEPGNVDLTIEVSNVANDGVILHDLHVLRADDRSTTSGGNEDVGLRGSLFQGGNFVTFHGSLESIDRINLSDDDTSTESTEGLGGSLTDITVTSNDGYLTGNHDVSGTLDTIEERFTASVQVIELGLGNAVVNVDGGELQLTLGHALVEVVYSSGGFLRET